MFRENCPSLLKKKKKKEGNTWGEGWGSSRYNKKGYAVNDRGHSSYRRMHGNILFQNQWF